MGYNAKESKEQMQLQPDKILNGVIATIDDGVVEDFVKNTDKWQGDTKQKAINVTVDVDIGTDSKPQISQLFTYLEEGGKTVYSPKSNLGKYHKKYGKLPEVKDQIQVITDSDGFGKIKIE